MSDSDAIMAQQKWDVVVIGLGPVGTTLCGLLGGYGLKVLGVDREKSIYGLPRAGHLDHSILRTMGEVGVLDEILAEMIPNNGLELRAGDGQVLARIPVAPRTPSGLPSSLHFHQPSFDRILRAGAERIEGVSLFNSYKMVDFTELDDELAVDLEGPEGPVQVKSRFLVGCDGASSAVRTKARIEMRDYGFAESWVVIDLILRRVPKSLPRDTVFGADPKRPYAAIELPGMRFRFEFMLLPDDVAQDITREDAVYELIAPWLKRGDVHAIERAIVYTFRGAQAETWLRGSIALAGDAAHLTPPFLGQGLCSGVRDAANLAWKLAAVINGKLPAKLLESYQAERSPHVDNVIRTSIHLAKNLCVLDPEIAAKRDQQLLNSSEPADRRIRFKLGELTSGTWVMENGGMYMLDAETPLGRLDELFRRKFGIIARNEAALGTSLEAWKALGAQILILDTLQSPSIEAFMARRAMDVLVVRPDCYVLGGGTTLDDVSNYIAKELPGGLLDV